MTQGLGVSMIESYVFKAVRQVIKVVERKLI